jgi:hypothetical protein
VDVGSRRQRWRGVRAQATTPRDPLVGGWYFMFSRLFNAHEPQMCSERRMGLRTGLAIRRTQAGLLHAHASRRRVSKN